MLRRAARLALLLGFASILPSCVGLSPEAEFILDFGNEERIALFKGFPLDRQYQIYSRGVQEIHPPPNYLGYIIAARGEPALRYVLGELRKPGNENKIYDSMLIFHEMQRAGHYSVCGDAEAMDEIRANGEKLGSSMLRGYYMEDLRWIEDECE